MSRKGLLFMEHHPWTRHPASAVRGAPQTRSLFSELSGGRRLDFLDQNYILGFCGAGSPREECRGGRTPRHLLVGDLVDDLSEGGKPLF